MTRDDQSHWDTRYLDGGAPDTAEPPEVLAAYAELFPTTGRALDLACGQGRGSVWLAQRGLDVVGLDVSAVAIEQARELARRNDVGDHCRFGVADLDAGLPAGSLVDVILCHKFRDRRLDSAIIERLKPGGLLAIATLSEVGGSPGRFRAAPGELASAFAELDAVAGGEGRGYAWLLARRPSPG